MLSASDGPEKIEQIFNFEKQELEDHLMYIASDELAGRRTASPGGEMAAQYIAKYLEAFGVKHVPGLDSYFQEIPFNQVSPPTTGHLHLNGQDYILNENLLILKGGAMDITAPAVFAGYGWVDETTGHDDYKDLDPTGKILLVLPGSPDAKSPLEIMQAMRTKRLLAEEKGAVAMFELYRLSYPWQFFASYFGKERLEVGDPDGGKPSNFVYGWLREEKPSPIAGLEKGDVLRASLATSGNSIQQLQAANVVGLIEGTDERLREEYVVLSAHYDHVGVGKEAGAPYTPQDSIFNGARDNGMGTVALMAAAKSLAEAPPRRSVIILACTGEEMGLLGSAWFMEHPVVPLEQMVFNLNNDGAGYNSTEHVSVIGLDKTNVLKELQAGARYASLSIIGDPAPEQNLYERSDNYSFAMKGIPAINIAPGVLQMDEEIFKYYHQATDNPDTIDYDYLLRFAQAYTAMARLIANKADKLDWAEGHSTETKDGKGSK
mgnify:CR=1 FL=1